MQNLYNTIEQLTSPALSSLASIRLLNDFAAELGWKPSDHLDVSNVRDIAKVHLVVEHGLENAAVISFLQRPWHSLDSYSRRNLFNISYNNLVDWHIQVQFDQVFFHFNRTNPPTLVGNFPISHSDYDFLRSEAFEQISDKKPNPNIPALDDALIKTISLWKRDLDTELREIGRSVSNDAYSALFNAIIFTRAVEDNYQRTSPLPSMSPPLTHTLLDSWNNPKESEEPLRVALRSILEDLTKGSIPYYLLDDEKLRIFDDLPRTTILALLTDFYRNKYASYYTYDFSLISKHALSRIYEQYVSVLRHEEPDQPTLLLFSQLPEEMWEKSYGSIYTPQYIARFFARYLREQMPPLAYKRLQAADPACGSGIFLRTLLELKCDPMQDGITTELIDRTFETVLGIDVDSNATQAAILSLSLLHLILTDNLPENLRIIASEAIEYYRNNPQLKDSFDAVIANPPFVPWAAQNLAMREHISEFMNEDASGRIDTYLVFLRLGLEMLKPGGYGMFVIPHSFLLGKNASKMRKLILETSWIRCLADLSAIRVFGDSGSYVILLIFQKKIDAEHKAPPSMVIRCQELVGIALQDALAGIQKETKFYSIYEVDQNAFGKDEWIILPPTESSILRKFEGLRTIGDFLNIREGFISGADDIFIIPEEKLPKGEESLYVPFLPDKEMKLYTVPQKTASYFFSSYIDGRKVEEEELIKDFPKTWDYLMSHKQPLQSRLPVLKGNLAWWQPVRPRRPDDIMRSKIISPHLVIVPRFSLDREGKYAVSHGPFLFPKDTGAEDDLLRFFLAVLNSSACYWYMSKHSHKYRAGYTMLEPKTLKQTPVPDPAHVDTILVRHLLSIVDKRLLATGAAALEYENQLDRLIADLYKLSDQERIALGMDEREA